MARRGFWLAATALAATAAALTDAATAHLPSGVPLSPAGTVVLAVGDELGDLDELGARTYLGRPTARCPAGDARFPLRTEAGGAAGSLRICHRRAIGIPYATLLSARVTVVVPGGTLTATLGPSLTRLAGGFPVYADPRTGHCFLGNNVGIGFDLSLDCQGPVVGGSGRFAGARGWLRHRWFLTGDERGTIDVRVPPELVVELS